MFLVKLLDKNGSVVLLTDTTKNKHDRFNQKPFGGGIRRTPPTPLGLRL